MSRKPKSTDLCGQVTPCRVTSTAGVSGDVLSGSAASQNDGVPVIERGTICHWDGLEALLHDLVYHQVSSSSCGLSLVSSDQCMAELLNMPGCAQLGWEAGYEGNVLATEPFMQSKVCCASHARLTQLSHIFCSRLRFASHRLSLKCALHYLSGLLSSSVITGESMY